MRKSTRGYALPLKQLIFLFLLLLSVPGYCQEEKLSETMPAGSKVYVTANHKYSKLHLIRYLEEWGYWKIVEEREESDFVIQVFSEQTMTSEHRAYAIINEAKSGKAIHKTRKVDTFGTISYHGRKAVMRRLYKLLQKTVVGDAPIMY